MWCDVWRCRVRLGDVRLGVAGCCPVRFGLARSCEARHSLALRCAVRRGFFKARYNRLAK